MMKECSLVDGQDSAITSGTVNSVSVPENTNSDVEDSNSEGNDPDNTNESVRDSNSVLANTISDVEDSNNEGNIPDNTNEDPLLCFCAKTQHKCSYCGEFFCNFLQFS